jgi:UDP-3-O-[3-hydroxymyristoyl] glucosamine N-acyltransferase
MSLLTEAYEETFKRCGIPEEQRVHGNFYFVEVEGLEISKDEFNEAGKPLITGRATEMYAIPSFYNPTPLAEGGGTSYNLLPNTGTLIARSADVTEDIDTQVGNRVIVGPNAVVGDGSYIDNHSVILGSIGTDVTTGEWCRVNDHAIVSQESTLGFGVIVSKFANVGRKVTLKDRVIVGELGSVGSYSELAEDVVTEARVNLGMNVTAAPRVAIKTLSRIGAGTVFGAGATVGKHVVIEDYCQIGPIGNLGDGSRVGENSRIGEAAILEPQAQLHTHVSLGGGVRVQSQAVVGGNVNIGADSVVLRGTVVPPSLTFKPDSVIYDKTKYKKAIGIKN